MEIKLNRKARRRLKYLAVRIENIKARRELIQMAREMRAWIYTEGGTSKGIDFALYITPEGLRYGEQDRDGSCDFEVYGQDGELLYGWGGDGLDLEAEVCGKNRPTAIY